MKSAGAGLISHLTAGQLFRRAELWTFTLADATVLRYTTADVDVKVGATTWSANGPVLTRPVARLVAGGEVNKFDVAIQTGPNDLLQGLPWPQAARRGALRGADLLIERAYMPAWGDTTLGKLYTMGGRIASVKGDGASLQVTVWSYLHLLSTKYPVDVVQPQCRHVLFDAGCTLSAAAFAVNGTALSGSTASQVRATLGQASGYFSLGRIVFTSGANNGQSRSIKLHTSGSPALLNLVVPFYAAPGAGDAFTVYPGCERTQDACGPAKFNNLANFGGEPYVPRPEATI
jgi:uncharacterized phage protein (TIGR02218 family)